MKAHLRHKRFSSPRDRPGRARACACTEARIFECDDDDGEKEQPSTCTDAFAGLCELVMQTFVTSRLIVPVSRKANISVKATERPLLMTFVARTCCFNPFG